MASSRSLKVEGPSAGVRLDAWIARQLPELSRARVQALIAADAVRLDGRPARPSARLRGGEEVTVALPDPVAATPAPEDVPLSIVYEDARLLVLDKPAGMTVHPGAGRLSGTLVNALLHHVRDLSGVGGVLRPGIVHRLDRGTSGLMVVAKDDETHRALSAQFS
ncbi:MAG TPA: RluA family pseudouridine synthase, partial [Vicinamibacteria bacterium]|nr:RluA family pseudouridine synthase [Vicinamibacteria bacterium]